MNGKSGDVSCSPLNISGAPQHNSTAALSETTEEDGDIKMKQLTNQKVKQNKTESIYYRLPVVISVFNFIPGEKKGTLVQVYSYFQ